MDILNYIKKNELLVRPTLVGGWWCGKWKGVTGDGKPYCFEDELISEGETLEECILNHSKGIDARS